MRQGVFYNRKTGLASCSKTGENVLYVGLILGGALGSMIELGDGSRRKIVYRTEQAKQSAILRERGLARSPRP